MQTARRIIVAQMLAAICMSVIWVWHSPEAALAALGGAGVAILPAAYMAWKMHIALTREREPRELVRAAFRGEMGKLAMTVALFALVVARFPSQFWPVMSAFVACLAMYWVATLLMNDEEKNTDHGQR